MSRTTVNSNTSSTSAPSLRSVEPELQADILSGEKGFTALSPEQERDLALRGQAGDRDALWALAMANHNFVRAVAQRYLRPELELEDLVAEGLLGLVEAAERFEPHRGVKFITYGSWWVKRALLRHLRGFEHPVHVPKYKQHELHEFKRSRARLAQELGRTPSLDELSFATGRDIRTLEELSGLTSPAESLDPSVEGGIAERLRSSDDVEALAIQRDALLRLDAVLPVLTERERSILEQRFGLDGSEPVTLAEIGQRVGLTKERVRQIEKLACARLQEALDACPALRPGSKTPTVPAERAPRRRARVHAA